MSACTNSRYQALFQTGQHGNEARGGEGWGAVHMAAIRLDSKGAMAGTGWAHIIKQVISWLGPYLAPTFAIHAH